MSESNHNKHQMFKGMVLNQKHSCRSIKTEANFVILVNLGFEVDECTGMCSRSEIVKMGNNATAENCSYINIFWDADFSLFFQVVAVYYLIVHNPQIRCTI